MSLMTGNLENSTTVTEFLLLGFGNLGDLDFLLFLLFLLIYIVTMVGNILIVALVVSDHSLHTPMYFFLGNLSCLEICYSSNIVPKMLTGFLHQGTTITVAGCKTQFYFFSLLAGTECYLLAVMSYDRYVAICKPLLYAALMDVKVCFQLAAGSWLSSLLIINLTMYLMRQLTFCGPNAIDHFFCDYSPLLKLSCSDTRVIELITTLLAALCSLPPFILTLASYICIILAILRISSTTGRQKAFSTCSSHLIVVSIFYGTIMIVYLLPRTDTLRSWNKIFSLFYIVLTPLFNPLIYSLRNKEVKNALRKALLKFCSYRIVV
ncbi:olfactory receptor 11A1-like [Hemicordylus capensis]|uniref:olfactory receptor 11A1-like n=1 Tax=Hemicordylus capensis TaxID=884348 RepID=UPI002303AFA4|nr:olfactory receptor 11A1-like [Hemicordylus capensis]